MEQSSDNSNGDHDLEFSTIVDGSIQQNVPVPPQTNSVLSNMIGASTTASSSSSGPMTATSTTSAPSSYTPSSPLPSALQFSKSSHPTACLFHVLFKALAFTLYMMGQKMMENNVMVTVLCIILLAADFWVVKNITGRLLVGLRWWNKVDPISGNTSWIFESATPTAGDVANGNGGPSSSKNSNTNSFDSKFFWSILYLTPVVWSILTLSAILFFKVNCWVTVSCAMAFSVSNVYGYYKCSADQRDKWNQWMNRGAQYGVGAMMRNGMFGSMMGRFMGGGGGGAQPVPQQDPTMMAGTFA